MNIDSFHTCFIKVNTFYLYEDMHLYFLTDHNKNMNTCHFIDCTEAKLEGKIDDIRIIQEVMEESRQITCVLPIDNARCKLLWYTGIIRIKKRMLFKPLQVWISEPDGELLVVHPDQSGVSKNKIRILATDSHITKPHFLLYENLTDDGS